MKIYVAAGALLLSAATASAADLAPAPVEPVVPVTAFNWTGFYVGAHAGYGWGREDDNQSRLFGGGGAPTTGPTGPTGTGTPADHFNVDGFIGGVHAGYNYQIDQFVLGAEGDIDVADLKGDAHAIYAGGTSLRKLDLKSRWQGSLRVRAGYAFDNLLIYATTGVAFADGKLTNSGTDGGVAIPRTSSSNTHVGWTVGVGAEYAFTQNWIGRLEVRYTDFQKKSYRTFDGPVKSGWDQVVATVGVSYKF